MRQKVDVVVDAAASLKFTVVIVVRNDVALFVQKQRELISQVRLYERYPIKSNGARVVALARRVRNCRGIACPSNRLSL